MLLLMSDLEEIEDIFVHVTLMILLDVPLI